MRNIDRSKKNEIQYTYTNLNQDAMINTKAMNPSEFLDTDSLTPP